ncbi:MAG: Pr6Pr family membrane protein [Microbacteriaceae bacterium]|nr:Pr6Pr family membrane protein [Microbacteriaceae bacterium]
MRIAFAALRILVAGAIVAAIIGQLMTSLAFWRAAGIEDPTVQLVNFFSFFTILSNVLAAATLLIGAALLAGGRGEDPRWFAVVRLCVTTYMVTTGIVYNLLLRGIELPQGTTLPWSNEVLHVVAPLWLLIDWLFAPGRPALRWRAVWAVVAFPIVWAVYTLVRGPLTYDALKDQDWWYPYPFLDPNLAPTGYWSVALYVLLIAAVIGLTGLGAVWVSRRRVRR